jgi:broad specificity phosphatase PhoE
MNTLILIRHGQSDQHLRDITGGWSDARLTELGREQALRAGLRVARLLQDQPAKLYTSDLSRAAEFAKVIGEIIGIPPIMNADLRELNNGQAAGMTRQEAKLIELPITNPIHDWVPYPGGESWRMMDTRVREAMEFINPIVAQNAVIVTHGNSGVAIIQWWLGLKSPVVPGISFQLDPGSITVLGINFWQERTIVKLNDTAHLHGVESHEPRLLTHEGGHHL